MIIDHKSQMANAAGIESVSFGIEGSAMIYRLMYSTMFQDKEKVVLQELAANANDAHRAAGKTDVPIKITLPTELSPELVVMDEGVGMDYDTVMNVYPVYGRSSKSGSNADIGGFGYGGKSPFSISDTYTVETTHKGVTISIACYLDNGYPKFSVFTTGEVGNSDGTIVKVPVSDPNKQKELKKRAENLFHLWVVKPQFSGHRIVYDKNVVVYENTNLYLMDAYNWNNATAKRGNILGVAVGPYIYSIPDSMSNKLFAHGDTGFLSDVARAKASYYIALKAGIGEIELSPSREWIEDTTSNVEKLLKIIEEEVKTVKQTKVPAGVEWYKQVKELIETDGIWSKNIVPSCPLNAPLIIKHEKIDALFKELRGTITNPLTENYDFGVLWHEKVYSEFKSNADFIPYLYDTKDVPTSLATTVTINNPKWDGDRNSDNKYLQFSAFTQLPGRTSKQEYYALLHVLGHVAKSSQLKRVTYNSKITSFNNYYSSSGCAGKALSTRFFDSVDGVILHPEGVCAKTRAYMRSKGAGNYSVIQLDDVVIEQIMKFYNKHKTECGDINFVLPDEVEKAYTAYRQELKQRPKATTKAKALGIKPDDVVVGQIAYPTSTKADRSITKKDLLNFDFSDKKKRYVIVTKSFTESSNPVIERNLTEKYPTLNGTLVFIFIDNAKTRTVWWNSFVQSVESFENVLVCKKVESGYWGDIGDMIQNIPEVVQVNDYLQKWRMYSALFGDHSFAITQAKTVLQQAIDCDYIIYSMPYVNTSLVVEKCRNSIKASNDATTAYAKLIASEEVRSIDFSATITQAEKDAFIKAVSEHLPIFNQKV